MSGCVFRSQWLPMLRGVLAALAVFVSLFPGRAFSCGPSAHNKSTRPTKYDFDPMPVEPYDYGPLVSERPRDSDPRSPGNIRVHRRKEVFDACYRWARFRAPELQGIFRVSATVDFNGCAESVVSLDAAPGMEALARCVQDGIRHTLVDERFTPRITEASFTVVFRPSGQALPRDPPPRPPKPGPSETCRPAPHPPDASRDVIDIGELELTDYSEAQARNERSAAFHKEYQQWVREGRKGTAPRPEVEMDIGETYMPCASIQDLSSIRETIGFNLGAYRRCLAQANQRHAGLTGRAEFTMRVAISGIVESVTPGSSQGGDPILESCLRASLANLWFDYGFLHPSRGEASSVIFDIPFDLAVGEATSPREMPPDAEVSALDEWSYAMLKRGDGCRALGGFKRLLATAPGHPSLCHWYAGALKATQLVAPWIEDPRVIGAAEAFVQYTNEHTDDPALPLCIAEAWPNLVTMASRLHKLARLSHEDRLLSRAAERYRFLLSATLPPHRAAALHYFLAELLLLSETYDGAAANYAQAVRLDSSLEWASRARESRLYALDQQERSAERSRKLSGQDDAGIVAPSEQEWFDACADYLENVSEKSGESLCAMARYCRTKLHGDRQTRILELFLKPCPQSLPETP